MNMHEHSRLNSLVVEISQRSGLDLELDVRGSCAIQYNDVHNIVLTGCDRGESVLFHSPLLFLCDKRPLEHLRHCMQLTLYGAETNGGAIGLDPESDNIILWRRLGLSGLDSLDLEQAIVSFTKVADLLRARLSQREENVAAKGQAESANHGLTAHAKFIRI